MKIKRGDLIIIQDREAFRDAVRSFRDKWTTATVAPPLTGMVTSATAMAAMTATATATGTETWRVRSTSTMGTRPSTETATERKTNKKIKLKYFGHSLKSFDKIVGIVTEIMPEEHSDFDVIKIREQAGGFRYCRRYILEKDG